MRKILLLTFVATALAFSGCSKDNNDDDIQQTFFVHLYKTYLWNGVYDQEELIDNGFVYLFDANGKTVDDEKSKITVVKNGEITYSDGSTSKPVQVTKFSPGIFTFENIQNGNYLIWATYNPMGWARFYSSYKSIVVNSDISNTTEKKVFKTKFEDSGIYIIQSW